MRIDILTLFPGMFAPVLNESMLRIAQEKGLAQFGVHDLRAFGETARRNTDDRPFGGGPGMVMMCQPVYDAVHAVEQLDSKKAVRVLLTPQGQLLKQETVEQLARAERLLLIAGHYEGIDERVIEELEPIEISVGDYVLSGGELPAMILIDAIVRLLPGALGHEDSAAEDSFTNREFVQGKGKSATTTQGRFLDCPHYTRPREWHGRTVPEVLLSGDHETIARWREQQMLDRTRQRRPDLMDPID